MEFGDDFELLAGGGAVDVDGDEHGAVAALFEPHAASLPEVVVLPEPWRPAIRMTVGGCEANLKRAVSVPRVAMSSSRTILTICSEGESAVATSAAEGFGADLFDEVAGDVEVDVGLEEGEADLAEGVVDVLVGEGALAAEGLEGALEFFGEVFKHGLQFTPGSEKLSVRARQQKGCSRRGERGGERRFRRREA